MRLDGKVMVVVGGSTGYGRAATLRLAVDGAHVVVIDADATALARVAADVKERSGTCTTLLTAPARFAELEGAAARVAERHLAVHALVTYHVDLSWGTVEDCDIAEYERVVQHNMVGPVAATKAFLPLMKAARGAAVVHIGSVDGIYGNPRVVAYSTSKAGLAPLTHIMAREFAPYEIRVNTVATALTSQDGRGTTGGEGDSTVAPGAWFFENLRSATPLKRSGPPEAWAGTVAYLASDDASYVTGAVVVVDCGRTGLTPGTFPWNSPSTT